MRETRTVRQASRVDRETGVREIAEFFGPSERRLFGFQHLPPGPSKAGMVVCSPLLAEFRRNYRREVTLARALAAKGWAVQRFHYGGNGNSDGDPADVTLATLVEDARRAAARLVEASDVTTLGVIGTRLGALVAATLARSIGAPALALWEPTLDASTYFRDAIRARLLRDLREGVVTTGSSEGLMEELRTIGRIDVLGYTIHRALYDSLTGRTLQEAVGPPPRFILLVGMSLGVRSAKAHAELAARWRKEGAGVHLSTSPAGETWWLAGSEDEGSGVSEEVDGVVGVTRAWALKIGETAWAS